MKELFTAFLSKTLNMDADSIAELLYKKSDDGTLTDEINEAAINTLLSKDAERVQSLKGGDGKTQFDNGYKKGQKEALEQLEKGIKSEFKTDAEKQGLDLIKHVVSQAAKRTLGDDEVKIHPLYLTLEEQARKVAEETAKEWEGKLSEVETRYNREKTFSKVAEKIQEQFEALRPVLPQNPTAAATARKEFIDKFASYDYEVTADGKIIVMKDGKRVETEHGHAVDLSQLVRQETERRFDLAVQDPKGNAGNTAATAATGGALKFKSEAEYQDKFFSAKTPEERKTIATAWEAQNGTN